MPRGPAVLATTRRAVPTCRPVCSPGPAGGPRNDRRDSTSRGIPHRRGPRTNMAEGTDNSIDWLSKGQGGIATATVLMPFAGISFLWFIGWSPSNGPRPDVSHRQDGRAGRRGVSVYAAER